MNIALWIITGLLAVAYGAGGISQIFLSKERYRALATSQHWVDDFDAGQIKAIGTIKLIGVVGMVVPPLVGIAPILSPIAACGLALLMAGAATTRFRRREWMLMAGDTAYMLLFVFVAWGRFALAPYGT